ncbi:MAG: ATP-binding cassette domain-containing protein [Agathobacter sp.]|nr:ATP-binding cassette domain-containing protein [Agathobacter sp.]MBQ3558963.1 ATP-binding cassette domain-containing protein [Agathobacter sp.]
MIELKNVSKEFVSPKKYPGFKGAIKGLFSNEKVRKVAVDDISFTIGKGEIVGYIGSNGAGKSTTIKMMTGILNPTTGTCLVDGIDPSKNRKENAQNIGVVFGQRTQLWWDLPLSESFTILKEIYDVSDEAYEEQMAFLNRVLELDEFFDRPVRTLSLGQRMRADLGAALLHNPKVLYLDEPTIGLDLVVKDNIRKAIKEINEKYQTTVILTTHDIGDIEELCSRIIIIDEGKKIYDGTLENLKDTYGTRRKVTMEVRKPELLRELQLFQKISEMNDVQIAKNDYDSVLDVESKTYTVSFDKHKMQVPQILSAVMELTEVTDIKLQETELAEIVKEIYNHGSAEKDSETMTENGGN